MTRQCKDCKTIQLLCAAEQSEQEASEIVAELKAENAKLKEILKSVRGYFIVLENIIPTKMLAEGSGVFCAINDAKKEIGEVLKDG